jgi:glycosyltransferase involved in cell wall biosynthesis
MQYNLHTEKGAFHAMLKLLFVSHMSDLSGGGQLSLYAIVQKLHTMGHELHVIFPSEGEFPEKLKELNISCSIFPYAWSLSGSSVQTDEENKHIARSNADAMIVFRDVIRQFHPDAVISNTIVVPWAMYISGASGIPNIMLIREWIGRAEFPPMAPTNEEYLRNINSDSDWVIYNSNYMRNIYERYIDPTKTSVMYPTVTLDKDMIDSLYRENRIAEDVSIIVAGSIEPNKNQLEAVKAIKHAVDRGVKITKALIIGHIVDEKYCDTIAQFIADKDLGNIVHLENFSSDIYRLLNDYNIVIVPSVVEPFGRITLEAQLFGRLVIGSNVGGTAELIDDRQTGLLYELGNIHALADAIGWVADHAREAEQIAKNAMIAQSEKFLSDDTLSPLLDAIEHLVKNEDKQARQSAFDPLIALMEKNQFMQDALTGTQVTLEHTQASLGNTQATLGNTQTALGNTQTALENTQVALENTQTALTDTQKVLSDTQAELLIVHDRLNQISNSYSYKLGYALLRPLRFVKRIFSNTK